MNTPNEQISQDEILRAVASSTAIETGQRIEDIEAALRGDGSNLPLVELADTPEAATGHVRAHGKKTCGGSEKTLAG